MLATNRRFLITVLLCWVAAGPPALAQTGAATSPQPWRAGELMVHPSATALKGRVTLLCQGANCPPLQCSWRDAQGGHRLTFAGGIGADYTGPEGPPRRLEVTRIDACENCRAQYLHMYWADPGHADADTLTTLWSGIDFQRGGEGWMGGFAAWPNQQSQWMTCTTR